MQKKLKTITEIIKEPFPKHIAVIGSGGKTGIILQIAREAVAIGKRVIITTTTKMWRPDCPVAETAMRAGQMLEGSPVVWAGTVLKGTGKIAPLPKEERLRLFELADLILTEADGSKGYPLKFPRKGEPVVPKEADHLLLVLGMDCLGRAAEKVCHHPEEIPEICGVRKADTITPEAAASILTEGYLKKMPPLPYRIVLNASVRRPDLEQMIKLIRLLPKEHCVIRTADGFTEAQSMDPEDPDGQITDGKKRMRIGAVLMAAGLGKRFGGDKLFAQVGNCTLIEKTLQTIPQEAFTQAVVVSKDCRILKLAAKYGFTGVVNENPEEGISSTIRLGTDRIEDLDAAMYFVCDQPYLTADTICRLVKAAEESSDEIIIPEAAGRWGNPCIFPKRYFSELMALEGDTGGKNVIKKHPDSIRTVEVPEKELLDIDKKEDLP